ncbi:MAG: polymer-forming cytoskeletal protein [Alphaproteobacteria bacterium]|nr:polymer-forming cytoskeletal protein [Alphaproteobacteria bacterium]
MSINLNPPNPSAAADAARRVAGIPGATRPGDRPAPVADADGSKLVVGRNIHLKGEITACERLVVEGRVEASIEGKVVEIAESGFFNGTADIDSADISGRFEGKLTARKRLRILSTGRVHGTIRYGQLEIEPGGEISGDIEVVAS